MPTYTYKCVDQQCATTVDVHRDVDDRNLLPVCADCGGPTRRKYTPAGWSVDGRAYIYNGDPNSWFE